VTTPTCPICHKNTEVRPGAWVGRWVCRICQESFGSVGDAELTERLELERNNWKQVAREYINRNNESLLALHKATAERETELADLKKARAEINTSYRLFDLVRYQRAELHRSGLITDEEYGWLCASDMAISPQGGSPSRQRLEDYDKLRVELDAVKKERDAARVCFAEASQQCANNGRDQYLKEGWLDPLNKAALADELARVTEERNRLKGDEFYKPELDIANARLRGEVDPRDNGILEPSVQSSGGKGSAEI